MSGAPDLSGSACYDKPERTRPVGQYVLTPKANNKLPAALTLPPTLPSTTVLVHGVNDVGVGYGEVERGLCAGLAQRLCQAAGSFVPGAYRLPGDQADDATRVLDDPDAVFFKRSTGERTHSPVIPFYWGYREQSKPAKTKAGQNLDRYGNRLDKDLSKGGGPFSNATTTLPDLWNSGHGSVPGSGDPIRPTVQCPGRLYMVLAAMRLAALVSMIKDWNPKEVVNLVAHSQGTLLSLLAQALLLDAGRAPADTLILAHSPYGLEDELTDFGFGGGEDAAMAQRYGAIQSRQTLHARLQTLVNLVTHARSRRARTPGLQHTWATGKSNADGLRHSGPHSGVVAYRAPETRKGGAASAPAGAGPPRPRPPATMAGCVTPNTGRFLSCNAIMGLMRWLLCANPMSAIDNVQTVSVAMMADFEFKTPPECSVPCPASSAGQGTSV